MRTYMKKIKGEIFIRLLFHLIYIAAVAALPYVIKNMIDCGFANGIGDVIKWTGIFILAIVIAMSAQYVTQRNAWRMTTSLNTLLRADLFSAIILKNPKEFREKESGAYGSMLNNDIGACEEYVEYIMEICESMIGVVVYAAYIFLLDYRIAYIIYLTAIITMFLPKLTGGKLSSKRKDLLQRTAYYNTKVLDLLDGYALVNGDTCSPILTRHKKALDEMESARYSYGKFKTFTNVLNGTVMYLVHIASFAIIAVLLWKGTITVGVATATIAYIQDFMFPLRTVIDSISHMKSVDGVKDSIINEIAKRNYRPEKNRRFQHNIVFEHVGYAYDSFELKDFNCTFEKGKKYAITGMSGTGKSTILQLMTGNLEPASGKIFVDGEEISYDKCLNLMGYVRQQSNIYRENFWDNVTVFGSYEMESFLQKYIPEHRWQYLTNTPDCGNLSGGEQQLISFVRALSSGRNILVLDEPFSALDKELELKICRNLVRQQEKTVIMITHNEDEKFLALFDEVIMMEK